jgi:hypothetical protein
VKERFHSRWSILATLIPAVGALGGTVIWAEGGWKVVVGLVSIAVLTEALLALALGQSLRGVFAVIRNATTALIVIAAVFRLGIAADRGASPSWLLAIPGFLAVTAVLIIEGWSWREPQNNVRLAVACLTQAVVVAASAVAVIVNLEMPN